MTSTQCKFFFDTADVDYIDKTWNKIKPNVVPESIWGVTTNPNAFSKVNLYSLKDWKERTKRLCSWVTEHRGVGGIVFVQLPNSNASFGETIRFVEKILTWTDGITEIGLKIPPFPNYLSMILDLPIKINVTGVADASTALFSMTYNPSVVSIIIGRMEEVGINAKEQCKYLCNAGTHKHNNIIAGSMRTIEGVKWAVEYGMIPTIGTRVWELITDSEHFCSLWTDNESNLSNSVKFSPTIDEKSIKLSQAFFEQMDTLGATAYKELLS